jgi:signal transduction histidine kinase
MELEREQSRVQAQAFSDLRHQIRSPILQAYRYVKQIPAIYRNDDRLLRSLNAIQGLTKRALSVAECVGFYAELARGNPPNAKLGAWPLATMRQELVEAAMDFQLLHTDKLLSFDVDRTVFDAYPTAKIQADVNLFLQCVYNLLENAGKYSFRNTVVRISGAIVQKQFILTVANTGIPLSADEAERCSERGWRSPSVKTRMKDSGHGIGLWIVAAIMKTHAGSFSAKATNILGLTEFNLSVPLEK